VLLRGGRFEELTVAFAMIEAARNKLKATAGWRIYEVPWGHDVIVDMPDRLTKILLDVA
jgi:hypothetical protein